MHSRGAHEINRMVQAAFRKLAPARTIARVAHCQQCARQHFGIARFGGSKQYVIYLRQNAIAERLKRGALDGCVGVRAMCMQYARLNAHHQMFWQVFGGSKGSIAQQLVRGLGAAGRMRISLQQVQQQDHRLRVGVIK